mgnify:CR=1 FL=1
MTILQAAAAVASEVPWWWLPLTTAAGWAGSSLFPVIQDLVKRRELAAERQAKAEERQAAALEQMKELHADIRLYMETQDFRWAAVESFMKGDHEKVLAPRLRERARGRTEGERGE